MWRSHGISYIVGRLNQLKMSRILINHACYSKLMQARVSSPAPDLQPTPIWGSVITEYLFLAFLRFLLGDVNWEGLVPLLLGQDQFASQTKYLSPEQKSGDITKHHCHIGKKLSKRDKVQFLVTTLLDLNDSQDSIYGTLDAWVAWEQNFPIGSLKRALHNQCRDDTCHSSEEN